MRKTPEAIDKMFSEIADSLKAGDQEVYMWLHGQIRDCEDPAALAMGVISRLLPEFDTPLH